MGSNYSAVNARTYVKSNSEMELRQKYAIKKVKDVTYTYRLLGTYICLLIEFDQIKNSICRFLGTFIHFLAEPIILYVHHFQKIQLTKLIFHVCRSKQGRKHFCIVLSKLLMINRQRCKMEHGAQDRQFKSKIEEDWMIMNIYIPFC